MISDILPEKFGILLTTVLLVYQQPPVFSYHDPTSENVKYHCWWNNASAMNSDPIPCQSIISIGWVIEPPASVEKDQFFDVSYKLSVRNEFYKSMLGFEFKEYSAANISTSEHLKEFCNNSPCPSQLIDDESEFRLQCCVWHANIHVCHPTECGRVASGFCGPWVSNDTSQSTHTETLYGNIDDVFSAKVSISVPGKNSLIAHIRLGRLQLAIGKDVIVDEPAGTIATLPYYAIVIITVFMVCLVFLLPILIIVCFCYRRRKLFYDESWIIDSSKIKNFDHDHNNYVKVSDGLSSILSLHSTIVPGRFQESDSCYKRLKSANISQASILSEGGHMRHHYTLTGIYEGRTVAIKKISKRQILLTNQIRTEVMKVRVLDHPNLCRFIGATILCPSIITEYCPKGSLSDVLHNQDIPLNWGFRMSFATDIARGMAYLHSKRMFHGRLSSRNCVIDDRWAVKVTDYGLPSFRTHSPPSSTVKDRPSSSVYLAPERRTFLEQTPLNVAADAYSFGIILLEISTRIDPSNDEIYLNKNGTPKPPNLKDGDCPCPGSYVELIKHCWSIFPANRPSFDQVKKSLQKMNPQKESPVDMMMIMMEKYSNHLEQLVAERTQELIAEQRKTANLLYNMLPKQVADELRHGRPAEAQSFKSSTIFFSDIVGFTSLAGGSTPMEVVNMLNELYSMFDDVLDRFDVYKVETIGDAYMVVSGVPQENGDKHAGEIAKMALKFLSVTEAFKIPHRPKDKLQIRIGIHTGPVCAGVVGLKMPRYCLFGDTVNTASRMESTSEAMKIQCSSATHELLKKTNSFTLECRGQVNIKGKGTMTTWWLTGHVNTIQTPSNQMQSLKLSPTISRKRPSSSGSSDFLGSPNLSIYMKHPFGCSSLSPAPLSPMHSRAFLVNKEPIVTSSVTNNQTSVTVLNLGFNVPGSLT